MRLVHVVAVVLGVVAIAARSAQAEEAELDTAPGATRCTANNQPPLLSERLTVVPGRVGSGSTEVVLRVGRAMQVVLDAKDPDGDALTFAARPLPEGASLDAQHGVLSWQPTRAQEGRYSITFEVTDGVHVAQRTFGLQVEPNRAPSTPGDYPLVRVVGAESDELPIVAWDADQDELTYEVRKLPSGARLATAPGRLSLVWQPTEADLGAHAIVLEVSDGLECSTVRVTVLVIPTWAKQQYTGWLLLGGGPSSFLTQGSGELLVGGALDVTLVAIREPAGRAFACALGVRDSDCHAGHHRFYAQLEVLDSLRAGAPSMFTYAAGYSASFEWYPGRRHLIPHYGLEAGGLVRADVGHLAQVRPYLGLHLWASDDLWIDAALGYRIAPAALPELSGPTFALGVVVNPW